eukprot:1997490-Alexandrium_andersonii.AAC.1
MSASLVGSEMCIRDSEGSIAGRARARSKVGTAIPITGGVLPGGIRCAGPVSYTHLTLPTICSV